MKSPIIGITLDFENNGGYSKFPGMQFGKLLIMFI